MTVRAKFRVSSVTDYGFTKQVKLVAVGDDGIPENQRYHKATPSGTIELTIDNPSASDQFRPQAECYVDFTFVENVK
jgi:hypothetical protein